MKASNKNKKTGSYCLKVGVEIIIKATLAFLRVASEKIKLRNNCLFVFARVSKGCIKQVDDNA